jgi:amidohydrolase
MATVRETIASAGELRRSLHTCPEISFEEKQTSQTIRRWLSDHGIEVVPEIAGTGLLVELKSDSPGPTCLFRADLDAIGTDEGAHEVNLGPILAAARPGRRAHHACGHDGHCSMLAGAVAALAHNPDRWSGSVVAVFQPAEEVGKGAVAMLEHEALRSRSIDAAFAIHNQPGLPLGQVGVASGVAALASTGLVIGMTGQATHASTPHKGNAAISAMATFIRELLGLPSHVVPFGTSVLITPTYLDAGRRQFGRVPPHGELGVVIRSDSNECLDLLLSEAKKRLDALASSYGLEGTMERVEPFPATFNDWQVVEQIREPLQAAGFDVDIREEAQPWSEDFGYFLQKWPGALMLLGAGVDHPSLHSQQYEFPDALLEPGVKLWLTLAGWDGSGF